MDEPTETPTDISSLPAQEPISGIPEPAVVEDVGHVDVEPEVVPPAPDVPETPVETKEEPAFFDRKEWEASLEGVDDPDRVAHLRSLEKMLLGQWTQKTQALSGERMKVEAYDAFMTQVERDPQGAVRDLQQQLGLTPQQATAVVEEAQGEKEYNTWPEVFADIKTEVMAEMRRELQPVMDATHRQTTQQVEASFDAIDPDWRMYEDDIKSNLSKYPGLASNIGDLYRLSVPSEVQEQKATKEALRKLEAQTKAAAPAAPTATRSKGSTQPTGPLSFHESYEKAKRDLG